MSKKLVALFSACLMLSSFATQAAMISYSYAELDGSFDSSASLLDYFNSQSSTEVSVTDFDMESTFSDSIMNVTFSFDLATDSSFELFAGLDAGYGAEIYLNDALVLDSSSNLWWSKSWTSSDVISFEQLLTSGTNTFTVVWAEECCGGLSSIAFSSPLVDAGDFTSLSVGALNLLEASAPGAPVSVNAPGTIGVLALGLLALVRVRNNRA
ncbi:CCXG family PEP-CTERM protein [Alteromonas stellipolaris]|jgi:hypothetical protein|uniref:CCXG family PEP-CTERM protein n=1 Tax=Alteromonas stellipolaris TaxID=233316 RepID=UPI002734A50C|nr:CCXG family PEP-CTERM protein [Alteromonas stellipolaris]MDP2596926.1 CCXG family PEP-CTERM protein [Alteromonas stellipolaris]